MSEPAAIPSDLRTQYERALKLAENGGYLQSEGQAVVPLIERIAALEAENAVCQNAFDLLLRHAIAGKGFFIESGGTVDASVYFAEASKPHCPECNKVGLRHCSDPEHCGGVVQPLAVQLSTLRTLAKQMAEALELAQPILDDELQSLCRSFCPPCEVGELFDYSGLEESELGYITRTEAALDAVDAALAKATKP